MPQRQVSAGWARAAVVLGDTVRTLREDRKLTQEQLAHRAGISRNQLQNIERSRNNTKGADGRPGPGNPRMDTVWALAEALGVEAVDLFPGRAALRRVARQRR